MFYLVAGALIAILLLVGWALSGFRVVRRFAKSRGLQYASFPLAILAVGISVSGLYRQQREQKQLLTRQYIHEQKSPAIARVQRAAGELVILAQRYAEYDAAPIATSKKYRNVVFNNPDGSELHFDTIRQEIAERFAILDAGYGDLENYVRSLRACGQERICSRSMVAAAACRSIQSVHTVGRYLEATPSFIRLMTEEAKTDTDLASKLRTFPAKVAALRDLAGPDCATAELSDSP